MTKAAEEAVKWGSENNVSFDIDKTEAILFTRKKGILRHMNSYMLTINGQKISFNTKATYWLEIWLDSSLSLKEHYQKCLFKADQAEKRLRTISKPYKLASGLIKRVQTAAVQSIALYGAELWWKGQKQAAEKLQKIINNQARAITGALKTSPVEALIENAYITPAEPLLDERQKRYAFRGVKQAISEPLNSLLPSTLKYGDEDVQPGQYSNEDLEWANEKSKSKKLSQRLAKMLVKNLTIDPSKGIETVIKPNNFKFQRQISILEREKAIENTSKVQKGFCL